MHNNGQTPIEELRNDALKHYEEASSKIHQHYSFVEQAIKAYDPNKEFSDIEILASIQHDIRASWMKYMFSKCSEELIKDYLPDNGYKTGNLIIPQLLVERWTRQINTKYDDLTEKEKKSDREQVFKFIKQLKQH